MKRNLIGGISVLVLAVIFAVTVVGCEAGLSAGDSSNDSGDDKFSFSGIYSRLNSMENMIQSMNVIINTQAETIIALETSLGQKSAPVGTILAWHRDLDSTPDLPEGWKECDGTLIDDAESVYYGKNIYTPDLNGEARFLRGGSSSGDPQDGQVGRHLHSFTSGHTVNGNDGFYQLDADDGSSYNGIVSTWYTTYAGGSETDSETRPDNMSVVWIMKIK
ncbi:MAG: tail fiber protein [bacterium]|nr:tail fiber protein [bacterium]